MANETENINETLKESKTNQSANDKGVTSTDLLCVF